MKTLALPLTLFTATTLAACGAPADEFRSALPQRGDVTVDVPAQTAGSAQGLRRQSLVGEPAEFYSHTYYESRRLNGFGAFVVGLVETITDYPATTVDADRATWGPFSEDREPNEFRLTVERKDAPSLHYAWALEGRPKSVADWTGLAGGHFAPTEVEDQGRGWFVVDFDAVHSLDPSEDGRGRMAYAFDKDGAGVTVQALFQGVDAAGAPVHAAYAFGQKTSGEGWVLFAFPADIHDGDPALAAPENLLIRAQWSASGAGRADVIATEGDTGEEAVYAAQCWDDTFVSTFEVYAQGETNVAAAGDPDSCRLPEAMPDALPEADALTDPFEAPR